MADKKIRLLIVTNSLPLPSGDFLRHKVVGLNSLFDLHLICWDTHKNKRAFVEKYPSAIPADHIHLYPKIDGWKTVLHTLFLCLRLFMARPAASIQLFSKIKKHNNALKSILHQYLLYAPILKITPDLIHFEFGTLAHRFGDVKKYSSGKVSSSFRGYDLNYVGLDDLDYYTKVWNTFDGFHFLGNDLKNRAIRRGYRTGKVETLISPAVDTSLFKPLNKEHNLKGDKLIIVSVSRLTWKKGLEYGIRAVYLLKQKQIPFEYRIIGSGDYLQALQFTIFELGLEKEVFLLGSKNAAEIKQQLSEADIFLHPAVSEGFCNAVIEAQAMGLPVVTTDADGLSENVADGETGFVVGKWDSPAMAEKLEWCYAHPMEARAMGQKGIERVQRYFRLEEQIKMFDAFYRQLYNNSATVNEYSK